MDALTTVNYSPLLSKRALVESPVPSVRPRAGQAAPAESLYQFAGGMPDPESFPFDGLRVATDSMLREVGRDAMTYGAMFGYDGLKELVCEKNRVFEGFEISADNLLITGARSALLTPAQARARGSLIPHAEVAIVPGSHGGFNRINELNDRIAAFIQAHATGRHAAADSG